MVDSRISGRIAGSEPANEADHFIVCDDCGQAFDCRDFGAVMHHVVPGHAPAGRQ
jgi:Fe2+ or Zn2+ uptake regulation protein